MITRLMRCLCLGFIMALAVSQAYALEVAGVSVEEHVRAGATDLLLNGAGLRTRLMFKVYVAALYLPQKNSNAGSIIGMTSQCRVVLKMLRNVEGETLMGALKDGLKDNHSDAEMQALQPAVAQLAKIFQSVGTAKMGDSIVLDFSTEGLAVAVNGVTRGQIVDGVLGHALLKVWLGEKPVDASLKKALLGV